MYLLIWGTLQMGVIEVVANFRNDPSENKHWNLKRDSCYI